MTGFYANIEKETLENNYFRKVLFTGANSQLVVMSLLPNEQIGMEVHPTIDQFFRIEAGTARVIMNRQETQVKADDVFIVPAGTEHNVINASSTEPLKLYTIYSPPNHPAGTIHKTKAEAEEAERAKESNY